MLPFEVKSFLSPWLLPPVSLFLLIAVALIVARWWPRTGRWLALAGACTGIAFTMPAVANRLIAWIEAPYAGLDPPPLRLPQARQAAWQAPGRAPQAIVLLAGGVAGDGTASSEPNRPTAGSLERIVHASRLVRLTGLPLLVTGGVGREGGKAEARLLQDVLEDDLATPVRWTETGSRDTSENAAFTAQILQPLGIRRILLVTHAYHMGRAEAAFARAGFSVTPAPHSFQASSRRFTPLQFLPSLAAVSASHVAVREIIGQAWYRLDAPAH